jgi:hypothetical protein
MQEELAVLYLYSQKIERILVKIQHGMYSISAEAGVRMLRIPSAERPTSAERNRVQLLKAQVLAADRFDRAFTVCAAHCTTAVFCLLAHSCKLASYKP